MGRHTEKARKVSEGEESPASEVAGPRYAFGRRRGRFWALLPVPLLVAAIVLLWVADLRTAHESPFLLLTLNFVFSVLASALIAYLIGLSFVIRGRLGLLMLGCGVTAWGAAGFAAAATGVMAPESAARFANVVVTIHNSCVWLSALCYTIGAILLLRQERTVRMPGLWLTVGYTTTVGAVGLTALWAFGNHMPVFFVQGEGGTPFRQIVLGSAIGMFLVTAVLMGASSRKSGSSFPYWYALALVLIAVGLFGVMVQAAVGSWLSWAGRSAQFLSGLYMMFAAVVAVRESRMWEISLQAALRESEERLQRIAQAGRIGFFEWNAAKDTTYWSPEHYELFGFRPGSSVAWERWLQGVHPDDRERVVQNASTLLERARAEGQVQGHKDEYRFIRPDGTLVWLESDTSAEIVGGEPIVRGLVREITERKQAEEALRDSEERLRLTLEAGLMGTFEVDLETGEGRWNTVEFELLGLKPGEAAADPETFFRFVHPHDIAQLRAQWEEATRTGIFDAEFRVVRADGQERWLAGKGQFIFKGTGCADAQTTPNRFMGVNFDITERKQAEEALRAAEELARQRLAEIEDLYHNAPVGLCVLDRNLRFLRINERLAEMNGIPAADHIGKTVRDLLPGLADAVEPEMCRILETGKPRLNIEVVSETPAHPGLQRSWMEQWLPIKDSEGRVTGLNIVVEETTERKQAEEQLRESEARYRMLHESMRDAFVQVDMDGRIIEFNEPYRQMLGYSPEEIRRLTYREITPERWHESEARIVLEQIIARGYSDVYEKEYRRKDGTVFPVELRTILSRDTAGRPVAMWGMVRDITERKRAEEKLRESEENLKRLVDNLIRSNRDLEEFAYVASHDLQEPLRMVSAFVQLLEVQYKDKLDEKAGEYIAFAVEGATRMQGLIRDLLTYSRVDSEGRSLESVPLKSSLEQALHSLDLAIKENHATITCDELPPVSADKVQMAQVFQNLIGNAIKFRGKADPVIHVGAERKGDEWLLAVRDNGVGFPQRQAERVFQLFQRLHTRGVYPGTGIGLTICKRVIERHGGRIWAESEPDQGATFYFTLPAEDRSN